MTSSPLPRALVVGSNRGDRYRAGRTRRALLQAGVVAHEVRDLSDLAVKLGEPGAVWVVRSGAWPVRPELVRFPRVSASGRPLCALGIVRPGSTDEADVEAERWARLQAETGGDFSPDRVDPLPPIASVYLDEAAASLVARYLSREGDLEA